MSGGIHANGTKFQRKDGENYTTIARLTDIGGPDLQSEQVEVTTHDSGGWREYIAGLKDGGQVSLTGNFIPSDGTHLQLLQDFTDGAEVDYRILLPDGTDETDSSYWTLTAVCTGLQFTHPATGVLGFTATLKISGMPELTPKSL